MKEVRKIKGLKTQLKKMEGDAEALKVDVAIKQREYKNKLDCIKVLKQEIKKHENNDNIRVSEHAIVRYFERVLGFDISQIEEEILSKSVLELVEKLGGSGSYPNKTYQVVIKNYTVTTII